MTDTPHWRQYASIESKPESMARLTDVYTEDVPKEAAQVHGLEVDDETPRVDGSNASFEVTETALSSLLFLADIETVERTVYESDDRESLVVVMRDSIGIDGETARVEIDIHAESVNSIHEIAVHLPAA